MTRDTTQVPTTIPVTGNRGEADARWWFGSLAIIKATAASTGGQLTIIDITEAPGAEAPLHVHHQEDEAFWILDGDVTFHVGETILEAHVGDCLFAPRGIPHRYSVGQSGCRMLFIFTPAGFEDLLRATSEPAGDLTVPPPPTEMPDVARISAIVCQHGSELLA